MTKLPRLFRGVGGDALTHAEHEAVHGRLPAAGGLIDACERAGLRGRGGAGFPAATKLRAAAAARGRSIVVANAAEGEPMSAKDRVLLLHAPHLVIDGAVAAAGAIGAHEAIVAIPDGDPSLHAAVTRALAERSDRPEVRVETVPDHFLTGQETALLQALAGRVPKPTLTPPLPVHRGLRGRPTLVHNAETLADLALIARGDAGPSVLVTLDGCVAAPGVHEIRPDAGLAGLIKATGGWSEPPRAVLLGGYHGTWVDPREIDPTHPARVAAGVVVALPASSCPVAEVSRVMSWLAEQTSGQCGPCVHGLAAIADEVEAVRLGAAAPTALRRLRRWSGQVAGRGACHHPDGSVRFLASALKVFEPEIEMHRRFGACEACQAEAVLAA
jgi:NADH:ubiquinone oxidoreductase subunit F (NADH-binding)